MQTQTLDNLEPYNEAAKLMDAEIHAEMLERINFLAREYEIRNPSEVARFLRETLFLFDVLKEIPAQIRKVFGEKQRLKLNFVFDPEDAGWHRIHVKIPTDLSVDESMQKLDEFDETWWFENEYKTDSKIVIRLEYLK